MKIRLATTQRISLTSACIFLFYACFILYHVLLYVGVEWKELAYSFVKLEYQSAASAVFCVVALGFLSVAFFLRAQKFRVSLLMFLAAGALIVEGIWWAATALEGHTPKDILLAPATPAYLMCAGFLFVGYIDELWDTFYRLLLFACCVFLIMCLAELISFHIMVRGIISAKRIAASGALYYFIYAFWLLAAYVLVSDYGILQQGKLVLGLSVILALVSVIFRSRSWIIQALILLLFVLIRSRIRWRNRALAVMTYFVCAVTVIVVFWDILAYMFSPLLTRLFDDTRTGQLREFFDQVSWKQLLVGGGMDAQYRFSSISSNYKYIDNQFLLTMFRYGIAPTLIYTVLLMRPVVHALIKLDGDLLRRTLVLIMWLAAMAGISVFFNLNVSISCVAMLVICGRLNKMCSMPKEKRR